MTIALSANTPRISYTVSQGVTQTSFAVPFVFFTKSTDLNVFVDNTERTFDASTSNTTLYTVTGGDGSTGTVTTSVTGATGGSTVVITRAVPLSRTTDFPSSGAFEISKLNTELDTITAIQSDFNDSASRAVRLQDSDSAVSMELPLLASRKGTVLGFNATTGAAEAGPTITAVQSLADVTASINLLGTSAVVTDMGLLATSANITAMGHLGTSANVTAMGLLGTSDVVADMALLGTSDVVADMALLADTDVIADMNTLATSDIISDLNTLATSDIVTDMNLLATSDNVTAMGVLGTSANVTNMATLGASGVVGNIATVAGVSSNVTTVAGISSNVTTVAGISSNVTTVAGVASNVTTVANNVTGVNSFAERYRVASSAPSTSLDVGDLYFDTTANELKVYKSSGWAAAGSTVNGTSERFTYNITGTPTTLTGASGTGFAEASGSTLAYDAGFIDVYLNGVKMVNGTDVTVTSGTSVVFASALSNGDVVDIVTFGTFNVANIVSTGALNSGSITSGFGNIDTGSSTITTTGAISGGSLTANGGVTVDNITIDGTEIDLSSGNLTIDVDGQLIINSDAGQIVLQDDTVNWGNLQNSSGDFIIGSLGTDKDIKIQGLDGSSTIDALTLDMSEGGDATFNGKVIANTFTRSDDTNTHIAFLGSDVTQFKNGNSESARFIASTFFKAGNINGTYRDATGQFGEFLTDHGGNPAMVFQASDGSFAGGTVQIINTRAQSSSFNFLECYSNNAADREIRLQGDGAVHADGAYNSTGGDYAEMFEWKDGNTSNEDRVGKTVVLDGNQIRLSTDSDAQSSIIGVVSARPVILGDAQSEKWKDKFETDDYGRYIYEEYTQTEWAEEASDGAKNLKTYNTDKIPSDVTVPKDAKVTSKDENGNNLKRRKLNSAFDESKIYIPREARKEFSPIGLVGKLRVNVGQTIGDRWIKMREISDTVHEYLVR